MTATATSRQLATAAGMAAPGVDQVPRRAAAGLPRRRHAGRGQDDLRAAGRRRAAGRPDHRGRHDRHAHRAPQAPVGARPRPSRASRSTRTSATPTRCTSRDYHGVAVTYAQIAAHPSLHRVRTENRKTLVMLDEVHHGGDAKSWGDAIREAFTPAVRRLSLTGTPFRCDDSPIPFVNYEQGARRLQARKADHVLRLLRRAARRRRPAGALPGVLRRGVAGGPARARSSPRAWASR